MRGKPLEFEVTASGCIVPTSHKLNAKEFDVSFSIACRWIRGWKV